MKGKDINCLEHTAWSCQHHVVFSLDYTGDVIYWEGKTDIGKAPGKVCRKKGAEITEVTVVPHRVDI